MVCSFGSGPVQHTVSKQRSCVLCSYRARSSALMTCLLHCSFPGGESYRDLIKRLESVIIDMEQQTAPVLVVSHVSVAQALISYFRQSRADQCMNIEVPMHTVIKFTPSRGGGWVESHHQLLLPEEELNGSSRGKMMAGVPSESELSELTCSEHPISTPIWGDHVTPSPTTTKGIRPL